MAYQRDSGKYESVENLSTHILSSGITLNNEIDDIIILNIAADGNHTITTPTGFTQIRHVQSGNCTHGVYWRRAGERV